MYCINIATQISGKLSDEMWNSRNNINEGHSGQNEILLVALHLLESGHIRQADDLLTAATLDDPTDPQMWLAAGLCRMRRGAIRSAEVAFEMSAWLNDDEEARELFEICSRLAL